MQSWVKFVNANGGIHGRPVKLIVYDAGGDPARARTQVKEAVERQGAIGFVGNIDFASNSRTTRTYYEEKRVPVIGSDWHNEAYESPMFFPEATASYAQHFSTLAGAAEYYKSKGLTKFGTVACVEAPQCKPAQDNWARWARGVGVEIVYQAKASITQPDYTAECLAAKNAGAQVLGLVIDFNSLRRFTASCTRQGYQPSVAQPSPVGINAGYADDANMVEFASGIHVFPWFQSGTPATDEFQRAMKASQVVAEVGAATGWVAGKLAERALSQLVGRPSSEALLQGLWTIKNDDLGGLTQPLTFVANKPAVPMACWWTIKMTNKGWSSVDGFTRHCQSPPAG